MVKDEMLEYLRRRFDPGAAVFDGPVDRLPEHWQDYASDDEALRLFALRAELNSVAPYLPRAAAAIEQVAVDAFLIESPQHGICRIIVRQIKGELFPTYSRLPVKFQREPAKIWSLIEERAPQALSWLYRVKMDGLTDIAGFVGFKSTNRLTTMAAESDTYAEQNWFDRFTQDTNPDAVVEILSSGGGGYLLVDLNINAQAERNPTALLLYIDEGKPPETVLLFQYLDNWMEIGLAENDL